VDVNDAYVNVASRCVAELGLEPVLTFARADMRDLSGFGDGEFDLVLANNSFIYVADENGAASALSEFNRVLSRGGAVLFYQANRWRWSEPFTGAPIVHLLPAGLAIRVAGLTGWRHNHGRVRLYSPPAMSRALRHAGLASTAPTSFRHGMVSWWPARNFGRFFGIAGCKR
jgi:SAM-dependent methyltransferase